VSDEPSEQEPPNLIRENQKLRALVMAVENENNHLQARIEELIHDRDLLVARVHELESDQASSAEQYDSAMQQHSSLANLYVASHTLHSTLDRNELVDGISQVIVNLVGCENYAIFERHDDELRVIASLGAPEDAGPAVPLDSGPIGTLVSSAQVHILDPLRHHMHAVIPLVLGAQIAGAIVIFELLPQKPALDDGDRELFEMFSVQAAMALHCASLHERQQQEVHSA
jgi:transcriptional regulator with GAF, ATPase, and Fis domain